MQERRITGKRKSEGEGEGGKKLEEGRKAASEEKKECMEKETEGTRETECREG